MEFLVTLPKQRDPFIIYAFFSLRARETWTGFVRFAKPKNKNKPRGRVHCLDMNIWIKFRMAEDSGFLKTLLLVWVFCFCYACSTSSKLQRRTPTDDDNKVIVKKVSEKKNTLSVLRHINNNMAEFRSIFNSHKHVKWLLYVANLAGYLIDHVVNLVSF